MSSREGGGWELEEKWKSIYHDEAAVAGDGREGVAIGTARRRGLYVNIWIAIT